MLADRLTRFCGDTAPLRLILRGGKVNRYHMEDRRHFQQNVSEHTWRLMVILRYTFSDISADVLIAALYHDVAEGYVGDVAAPLKKDMDIDHLETEFMKYVGLEVEEETNLSDVDYAKLKICDYMELCEWCHTIKQKRAWDCFETGRSYVRERLPLLSGAEQERVREVFAILCPGERL